jgi:DNA-binding transcriptional regulator YdaS (Cro superfamily)
MTLNEYFADEPRGAKLEMAQYLGVSATWLSLILKGTKRPSAGLCLRIEQATQGLVTRVELRSDLFA